MTQKIEDLLKSFSNSTYEEQLAKVKQIRSARNVERPAAAVRRVKREVKKSAKARTKSTNLIDKLSPAEKETLLKLLLSRKE